MKIIIRSIFMLFFLLQIGFTETMAQSKQDSVLITSSTDLGNVASPYAFTFLHEKPRHKVDLWVSNILHTTNYNDERMPRRVDELGAIRTKDAFRLLYVCCCVPITAKTPTTFTELAMAIRSKGGYKALNQYFLSRAVPETLAEADFKREVMALCHKLPTPCYRYTE